MNYSSTTVAGLLSSDRLAPYLRESDGDLDDALALYTWCTRMSMSMFELLSYLEVMLRNAIDAALAEHFHDREHGIPWFLRTPPTTELMAEKIDSVRSRLRPMGRDSRQQIIAGLSFGFWSGMVGVKHDDLWRTALHAAFSGAGSRKEVMKEVEALRKLRNRLAHHDSVLSVDVPFEVRRMHRLAGFLGPDAEVWLRSVDQTVDMYRSRPHSAIDTVVVPAAVAWDLYVSERAYVCQAGRAFRAVERMAFYCDHVIKAEVPRIKYRRDDVPWSAQEAARLAASSSRDDRKIARVIEASRQTHWTGGSYQVFLLTSPGDPQHRSLPEDIPNRRTGRGSAFVQKQRYVSLHRLETALTTDQVVEV